MKYRIDYRIQFFDKLNFHFNISLVNCKRGGVVRRLFGFEMISLVVNKANIGDVVMKL